MATLTGKDIDKVLIARAQKIVKEADFNWGRFIARSLEKVLTETTTTDDVIKIMLNIERRK